MLALHIICVYRQTFDIFPSAIKIRHIQQTGPLRFETRRKTYPSRAIGQTDRKYCIFDNNLKRF